MTSHRVSNGGLIDRSDVLGFSFDGKPYTGCQRDTLASALLANAVRIIGCSFKYHRPRGVWGAWFDDPNAIFSVILNGCELPNCQATTTPLVDGMVARPVNANPSAQFDIKGGLDLFHRWLAAGFYYRTFMWPDWHLFEPMIRKMAGLGSLNREVLDDFTSDQVHEACEEAREVDLGQTPEPNSQQTNKSYTITALWPKPGGKGLQWIDFQHDVTLKDVELAARENCVSVEHLKRYTKLGMASDQGKTSNMAGLAAMAAIQGREIPEVGTTTFRPPFVPVPLEIYQGHHLGQLLQPFKRLELEPIHRAADAALSECGG